MTRGFSESRPGTVANSAVSAAPRPRRRKVAGAVLVMLTAVLAAITLGLSGGNEATEAVGKEGSAVAVAAMPAHENSEQAQRFIDAEPGSLGSSSAASGGTGMVGVASGAADLGGARASAAPGLVPLHILALPETSTGALVIGAQDNHLVRIAGRSALPTSISDEVYVAIGKAGAHKQREGDEKTPIGVYWVRDFIPGEELPEIYGEGAYPISYPNLWDRRAGRTGSGIWIHGTNKSDDELLPRSSRGCLTLRNQDFLGLDDLVVVDQTPVIIADRIEWVPRRVFEQTRQDLLAAVERWELDWESLDTDRYLSHYAEDFRAEGMDLARWSAHKKRVNAQKKQIEIELDELSAFTYPGEGDVYLVTFRQVYRSDNFNSVRYKSQYWRSTADGWRIVQEGGI